MTVLDVIILMVFVGAVGVGFYRGIIVQVGAVAAILFAVVLCRLGGDSLAAFIAGGETPTTAQTVMAKVIVFVIGYLSVRVVAGLCKKLTHALSLGGLDRLGGVVFALFQWMLILSVVLNLWQAVSAAHGPATMSTLAGGEVVRLILRLAPGVLGWATS